MTISPENTPTATEVQEKVETQVIHNPSSQAAEVKTEEKAEDPNWKAFRDGRKQDRALLEAAERKAAERAAEVEALKAAMEAAFAKENPQQRQQQSYGYDPEENEEDRVKKLVQAEIERREAEAERIRSQREQQEYPQRLQKNFPDFQQTISSDNLDYLDFHYPEVSRPLQRLANDYDKWHDIYKAVKKFVPNNQNARQDAAKAESNFNKPKSMSTTSVATPGDAAANMRLSEERKAANWQRMQNLLKGVS